MTAAPPASKHLHYILAHIEDDELVEALMVRRTTMEVQEIYFFKSISIYGIESWARYI